MSYYEGGERKSFISYQDGLLHGEFSLYYPNGPKRLGHYLLGKREGRHQIFYPSGNLLVDAEFSNGEPVGFFRKYFPDQSLREELYYHDPLRFNKLVLSQDQTIEYEGTFSGNRYTERRFVGAEFIVRQGSFGASGVVWDC